MTPRLAASTVIVVALAAPAPAAAAPALAPLRPCYVVASPAADDRQAVAVSGTGFTPGALVDVTVGGRTVTAQADATGALPRGTVAAPYVTGADRPFTVTATERDTGLGASVGSLVTRLRVTVSPTPRRARARVRFAGTGFIGRRPVFAHYVRGGAERFRVRATRRPDGPCGAWSARMRLFAFSPRDGRWTIQFDQQRRYERRPGTVFFRLPVDVSER